MPTTFKQLPVSAPAALPVVRSWVAFHKGTPHGRVIATLNSGLRVRVMSAYYSPAFYNELALRVRESWLEDGVVCYAYFTALYSQVESLQFTPEE